MTDDRPALPNPLDLSTPVRTARLELRLLEPADVDAVHAYQSDPDVCRYLPWDPRDRDTVAAKIEEHRTHPRIEREGDYLQLAVVRLADRVLVGELYFTVKTVEHRGAEIGWVFAPEHHGNGYATEAATAMLRLAFGHLGLHRVIANLDPRNEASARVCRRLGMREEARFLEDYWSKGEWGDSSIYAILDREFVAGGD